MSQNWKILKNKIEIDRKIQSNDSLRNDQPKKRRREISESLPSPIHVNHEINENIESKEKISSKKLNRLSSKIVALDCEMVGIGLTGKQSALARCSLVDFYGNEIYDKFVRPPALVTDFRTQYSGVRRKDLRIDKAITLIQCQDEVAAILQDKILVGHALKNDLNALMLKHKKSMIRDTAQYRPYMRPHGRKKGKFKPRALRDLSKQHLGKTIQTGEHDSCEDARAALNLYKLKQEEWEEEISSRRDLNRKKGSSLLKSNDQKTDNDDNDVEVDDNSNEDEDVNHPPPPSPVKSIKKNEKKSIFGLESIPEITDISMVSIQEADKRAKKARIT